MWTRSDWTCSEDDPCPVFLELNSVDGFGANVFVTGNLHTVNTTMSGLLLASDDSGKTWTEPGKRIRSVALEQIQFVDPQHGWVSGVRLDPLPRNPFLFLTVNGGEVWHPVELFDEPVFGSIQQFWFESANRGQLMVDRSQGKTERYELYETSTGGEMWALKQASEDSIRLQSCPPERKLARRRRQANRIGWSGGPRPEDGRHWPASRSARENASEARAGSSTDAIELELFRHFLVSIAEEMGVVLRRSSYSVNIKERRDYSCAVYDAHGETVAMGDHMPVHLGAMPLSVRAAREALELGPGDVALLNDPFRGGTHLPDITAVAPACSIGTDRESHKPPFYLANRAHHSDVGGMSPGSMPLAREIYQEGIRIPPVHLVRGRRDRSANCSGCYWRTCDAGGARGRSSGATRLARAWRGAVGCAGREIWARAKCRPTCGRFRTTASG